MTQWDLMRLSDIDDDDAYEPEDFITEDSSFKTTYRDFYDDVKQSTDYITEDW